MARPYERSAAGFIVYCGFTRVPSSDLSTSQYLRRDDFVRTKCLSRVNKGSEDFSSLSALACLSRQISSQLTPCPSPGCRLRATAGKPGDSEDLLFMDEGRGLWIPRGILDMLVGVEGEVFLKG